MNLFAEALKAVQGSPELQRILDRPERDPEHYGNLYRVPLTERLRLRRDETPPPDMPAALRWHQALALVEAHDLRAALVPLPVGAGKTLITALLPTVLASKRPVIFVPAKLRQKTAVELAKLAQWWDVYEPTVIASGNEVHGMTARWGAGVRSVSVVAYELISTKPDLLDVLRPDALICDESFRLKNTRSARKKRIWRYMRACADAPPVFVCLTGSVQTSGFSDWWHIQAACTHPTLAPLPHKWPEMIEWDQALGPNQKQRRPLGSLSRLSRTPGDYTLAAVQHGFGERFRRTPGIITCPTSSCSASLTLELQHVTTPELDQITSEFRATWDLPDGTPITEGSRVWAHMREMANGLHYQWRVPGPPEWMDARREAARFVREVLSHSRKLDTELQVYQAYPQQPELLAWRQIKPTFTPEPEPVWHTHKVIDYAVDLARQHNSLIWVEHRFVGEEIAARHGLPYFRAKGCDPNVGSILEWPGGPCVVSTTAVGEGFNLQHYTHNVILNVTPNAASYEQLMGRTHRQGQNADVVEFVQIWAVQEQLNGLDKATHEAQTAQRVEGQQKKLVLADRI